MIKADGIRHGERGAAKGRKVGIVELSSVSVEILEGGGSLRISPDARLRGPIL
jgi:hypothetical protein